jgi:hypothetical protein
MAAVYFEQALISMASMVLLRFPTLYNLNRFPISIPSAIVPTRASIAYPSFSNLWHSDQKSVNGTVKTSINSFSSRSGFRFWLAGLDMSIVTWTIFRFVLQKPGSVFVPLHQQGWKVVDGIEFLPLNITGLDSDTTPT